MTELDAFEQRVAETLRWYADDVTPTVDAADVAHRVAVEHPRRRKGVIAWRPAALPRVALVLVLLAGLLAAMVGGVLIVGSQPVRKLPEVVPPIGQVSTCPPGTNPDEPGPVDQTRPPMEAPVAMAFDRHAGKLVVLVSANDGNETWTFDVCTNTWAAMHPASEAPDLGELIYDVDSDVTIGLSWPGLVTSPVWAYDLEANTWTENEPLAPRAYYLVLRFYDPVSGLAVATGDDRDPGTRGTELWSYDVETDTWAPIPQAKPLAFEPQNVVYDASVDRLVANVPWQGGETWLFDLRTGTWSGDGATTPEFSGWYLPIIPAISYAEAAERTVMSGGGRSAAYDATADRWETLYVAPAEDYLTACGARPDCRTGHQMVYDAVNERLVAYGGTVNDGWTVPMSEEAGRISPDDVLAFDMATREWTVLLEASQPVTPAVSPSLGY